MTECIARHRDERDQRWTNIEEPIGLAQAITAASDMRAALLVNCLTLFFAHGGLGRTGTWRMTTDEARSRVG